MTILKRKIASASFMLMLGIAGTGFAQPAYSSESLQMIVAGDHRSDENKARDQYRNPIETLKFFDVQPEHTVVEINPGGGWYTEILGPYLKDEGELYLAIFHENSERSYAPRLNTKIKEMTADKELYGTVNFSVLDAPLAVGPVAPEGSADRVLTFRNVHNWMSDGAGEEAFQSFYDALKPGGILGVVEHRATTDTEQDPKAESGYVREDYVIKLATDAGFELVEASEINANPKDTADHEGGVWDLLPRLRVDDAKKEEYQAIGESDRMTLKFVKPAAAE